MLGTEQRHSQSTALAWALCVAVFIVVIAFDAGEIAFVLNFMIELRVSCAGLFGIRCGIGFGLGFGYPTLVAYPSPSYDGINRT